MNFIQQLFQRLGVFGSTLVISVLLHAAMLTVRVAESIDFARFLEDTPLEVVLVNAQSTTAPDKAQAIAQHNLEGGGDVDKKNVVASSPAPYSALTEWGQEAERQERQAQEMQAQQAEVFALVQKTLAQMPEYSAQEVLKNKQAQEEEDRRRALLQQLGAIEKRINEENSRPKKRFVSPATKAGTHAHYYAAFKDKVEALGTSNFPTQKGQRIYGELSMVIHIDAQGRVLHTEILQGSGNGTLDAHAQAIVRAGSPYGNFTPEMLKEFQVLVVASHFRFAQDVGLSTRVHEMQ